MNDKQSETTKQKLREEMKLPKDKKKMQEIIAQLITQPTLDLSPLVLNLNEIGKTFEEQIRRETTKEIARNLIPFLAIEFIADKTGVDIIKVQEIKKEFDLCKKQMEKFPK